MRAAEQKAYDNFLKSTATKAAPVAAKAPAAK
jgi:hypothetical protein